MSYLIQVLTHTITAFDSRRGQMLAVAPVAESTGLTGTQITDAWEKLESAGYLVTAVSGTRIKAITALGRQAGSN